MRGGCSPRGGWAVGASRPHRLPAPPPAQDRRKDFARPRGRRRALGIDRKNRLTPARQGDSKERLHGVHYTRRRGVSAFEDERPGAGNQPSPAEAGWVEVIIAKAHSSADAGGQSPRRARSALEGGRGAYHRRRGTRGAPETLSEKHSGSLTSTSPQVRNTP